MSNSKKLNNILKIARQLTSLSAQLRSHNFARLVLYLSIILPFVAALLWQVLFAMGIHPGQSKYLLTATYVIELIQQPGIWRSVSLSLATAVTSTLIAMGLVVLIVSFTNPVRLQRRCRPWMALLLSTPYLAFVVGWQFVISPSGLVSRLIAQFTGNDIPPAITTAPDAWYIGYVLMLAVKESGFLLMLLLAQLPSVAVDHYYRSGVSLGYTSVMIWRKLLLPLLYPRLRTGIWVLLVYSATNVEVAMFAAPNLPELYGLRVFGWFAEPDLDFQLVAAAGIILLIAIIAALFAVWLLVERILASLLRAMLTNGKRGKWQGDANTFNKIHISMLIVYLVPLVVLFVWSISNYWSFPQLLPESFTLRWWYKFEIQQEMLETLKLALAASLLALAIALIYLETVRKPIPSRHLWLLYLPLVTPQIGLAAGLAINANLVNLNGSYLAVLTGHLMLVTPYTILVLAPVWQEYDQRYSQVAASLGHSPWYSWWKVKLPLCIRPVLFSLAVGISVSVNLYIPTAMLGEGKVTTLMTEMVGLGVSYDRRQLGVFSIWLLLIPLLAFALGSWYPTFRYGKVRARH